MRWRPGARPPRRGAAAVRSRSRSARAAGVARRTLYGHFPNREALVSALAEEAKEALGEALAAARRPGADPATATALARLALATWAVGDRHRMLISLARRDLGEDRIRAALAPVRAEATAILERGQREGVFAGHLPAPVLAVATESLGLAVLESQAQPGWSDPAGRAAATAVLVAAGIAPADAGRRVVAVLADTAVQTVATSSSSPFDVRSPSARPAK